MASIDEIGAAAVGVEVDTSQALAGINQLNTSINQLGAQLNTLNSNLNTNQNAFNKSTQSVNTFNQSLTKTLSLLQREFSGAFRAVQAAIGGFGLSEIVEELVKVNVEWEKTRLSLVAGATSILAAGDDFAYLREEAQKLGLPISQVGLEFARMTAAAKGTALQGQGVRDVFEQVSEAGIATGKSTQSMNRIFLALTEMLSTSTVTAREARIQFGQQLPGGFAIMAEAYGKAIGKMNLTTQEFRKAIQGGGVDAVGLLKELPSVLEEHFGEAFKAVQLSSPALAIGQFTNAIQSMFYTLGQNGFMLEFIQLLHDIIDRLSAAEPALNNFGRTLGNVMADVRQAIDFVLDHWQIFAGVFAGLVAGVMVRAVQSLISWMLKLGEVEGIVDLLNPITLVVAAIGLLTFGVIAFGDKMVQVGGQTVTIMALVRAALGLVWQTIQDVGASITEKFGKVDWGQLLANGLQATVTFIVGAIQMVGDAINLIIKLAPVVIGLFQPLLTTLGSVFSDFFSSGQAVTTNTTTGTPAPPPTSAWQEFEQVVSNVWDVFSNLMGVITGVATFISNVLGPVLHAVIITIASIADVVGPILLDVAKDVGGAIGLIGDVIFKVLGALGIELGTTQNKWLDAGDLIVGVILNVIQGIGLIIAIIADLISALGHLKDHASDVFGGMAKAMAGAFTGNLPLAAQGAAQLAKAWGDAFKDNESSPQDKMVADLAKKMTDKDTWTTVSRAVAAGAKTTNVFKDFGSQIGTDLNNALGAGKTKPLVEQSGTVSAQEWGSAFLDQLSLQAALIQAQDKTNADNRAAYLKELAKMQHDAWLAGNENLPDSNFKNESTKKTPAQKAAEQTSKNYGDILTLTQNLATVQDFMTGQLDKQLGFEQATAALRKAGLSDIVTSAEKLNALKAAQEALNRVGFTVSDPTVKGGKRAPTVQEVVSGTARIQGGGLKQAQNLVFSTEEKSLAEEQSKLVEEALKTTDQNNQGIQAAQDQIKWMQDLSTTTYDWSAALAANQALRKDGFSVTYQEIEGMSDYEKANNATAAALAESTYNDKLWQQEVKATETLLNDIKGYQYMTENITDLTVATLKGGGVLSQYNAQLAAQAEVMKAFGDKTFDPNRLNQKTPTGQDAGQVYNDAFQTSLIGGSSEKFAATLNTVHDNYLKLFQPTQQYREELQKTTDVTMASIKAYEQMAEAQAQSQIGKGQADLLSGDPNGAAEIAQGIKNFTTARDLADKAINELKTTSTLELQQHSDNFGDAFEASFQKLNTDAHAFSTEMQKTWTDAFDGMTSALVNLVMTGKANFTDLTKAVLTDIATMIIKWLEWKAISTALNFLLPGSGSLVGDGSMAGSASGLIQLANGGVMTSAGLRKYAGGGIANVPQLAMFGEGSMPEAYVPLPDGRTIPVTMTKSGLTGGGSGTDSLLANMISSGITTGLSAAFTSPSSPFGMPGLNANQPMGGSGGGNHIELHSTVIVQNSGSMTNQNGGLDSKAADDLSKRIHTELRGMVVQEVLNQSRPGGTLNPIGSIRSGRLGQ